MEPHISDNITGYLKMHCSTVTNSKFKAGELVNRRLIKNWGEREAVMQS
jgi:hypothetical protein